MEGTPFDRRSEESFDSAEVFEESPLERLKKELGVSENLDESEILAEETAGDDTWESVLDDEPNESLKEITTSLRYLLSERRDVLNPGAVDEAFVESLGLEVCTSPALVEIIIDVAKEHIRKSSGDPNPKVPVEDLVPAWQSIEQKLIEDKWNEAAEKFVIAHAIAPEEAQELRQKEPGKLRSLARLLDAPISVKLSMRLAEESLEGKTYSVDEIMIRLAGIKSRHNRQQASLDAGEPAAIKSHNSLLKDPAVVEAADELAHRREFELDRPDSNIPPQDEI